VEKPIVLNLLCQTLSRILLESPLRALQCGGMTGADGSRIPLSALMASTLSFVLPSDGISNTPCLVSCPRACKTRWFGVPSQKNEKHRQKNIEKHRPGLLLRRLLSFHCPFTDQRCLDIWFYNGLFFGKLQPLAPLWGDWALPFAELCPHHCTGWSEAPPWNLPVALVCGGVLTTGYAWQTAIAT